MPRYFDDALPQIGSADLKPMVKAWGGDYKMRKEECIAYLRAAFKDPEKVRDTLAKLEPWERNILAIIRKVGGVIKTNDLLLFILTYGLHPPRPMERYRKDFIRELFRRGLLISTRSSYSVYSETDHGDGICYSDERILAQIGEPTYKPFDIQSESLPGEAHFRPPTNVIMDLMSLLLSIETLGGLRFTQSKTMRVGDETKLRRAMKWENNSLEIDGFSFPSPLKAWLEVLFIAKFLTKNTENQLTLAESPARFAQRPRAEQMRLLVNSFVNTQTWQEREGQALAYLYSRNLLAGRFALVLALTALPLNPEGFFSIEKFEQALFQRIGYDFSFDHLPAYPYFFRETPQEQAAKIGAWEQGIRANWVKQSVPWLASMLTTWLYFLGLVELRMDGKTLIGFRLTELGRETFHPELASDKPAEPAAQASAQPTWVVQPNFDIIAYLDRVSAPQLAFLERCAERTETHKHTAHYHLTRESVYRGLESGLSPEDLLKNLQLGSLTELSQNIQVELREWASLRERILLRRKARLVEFSSAQALKAGLAQGLTGSVVAERFLLMDSAPRVSGWHTINYAQNLPPNLTISETGLIHWKPTLCHDLMTAAQLTQWAEPTSEGNWQLTCASVTSAIKPGKKLSELLSLLQNRVFPNVIIRKYEPIPPVIPPLLEIALRAWAGTKYPVELETAILLRCPHEKVFQAVIASPLMKSLLKGYLDPDLLLVDSSQLEALRQRLDWLGWKVSEQLQVVPLGNRPS